MRLTRLHVALAVMALGVLFFAGAGYYYWREQQNGTDPDAVAALPDGAIPAAIRLTVAESGLTGISAATLDRLGLPYDTFAATGLSLTHDGEPVPFTIVGSGAGAELVFLAEAMPGPAVARAVYWLAPGTGESMLTASAEPSTDLLINIGQRQFRYEPNTTFVAFATGDDHWFAQRLFAPGPTSSFTLPLNDLQAVPDSAATLKLRFWSNNDISALEPDHHLQIQLNGQVIGDHWWDGASLEELEVAVPAGLLTSADNSLTLTLPGDTGAPGEDVYLDFVELTYEGALSAANDQLKFSRVTGSITISGAFTEPIVVDSSGARLAATRTADGAIIFSVSSETETYWVADRSQLRRPRLSLAPVWEAPLRAGDRGAEYVAIVAEAAGFTAEVETLLAHRQRQGLSTSAISVSQIYDEFGYGRQTPDAIRDFISYAVANWQPAPRFILLVGDASYDIHNFNESENRNLIPAPMIYTQFAGYVASDTWYTLADGSLAPNTALGRLPVENAAQLEAVIAKIIAYEGEAAGSWQARALLVADDEPLFDTVSDGLAEQLGAAGYSTDKLYLSVNEAIHDDIIAELETGVGLLNYVGHGSIEVWGDEQVLRAEDAAELDGTGRFPIFTTFTCLNGYFNHPQVDALAETMLWVENGGIVAAVAPSGRSLTTQQQPIADVFFAELLANDAATLGEALMTAKVQGADNTFLHDVIHTFNLLGDPALRFQHPGD